MHQIINSLFRMHIGLTAAVISRLGVLTPPRHVIPPPVYPKVHVYPNLYLVLLIRLMTIRSILRGQETEVSMLSILVSTTFYLSEKINAVPAGQPIYKYNVTEWMQFMYLRWYRFY